MGLREDENDVDEDVWDAVWCPFCGSQDFVRYEVTGIRCDGCHSPIELFMKVDESTKVEEAAVLKFKGPSTDAVAEGVAQDIDGVGSATARMNKRDGRWYLLDWLKPDDFVPCQPDPPSVDEVEDMVFSETDRARMVN
jgi:ribosomal protein L37AE/L43A